MPSLLPEDAFGRAKRQSFVEAVIRRATPRTVLDFGCGTGSQLTLPLAEAFPQVAFLGVEVDEPTIAWARRHAARPNITYATSDGEDPHERFDMIIASEVLEHVEAPDALLRHFHARLADRGCLVVTVPNGYGPFEWASLLEHLLTLSGVLPLFRAIKRSILGRPQLDGAQALTLAVSPHVNFFSLRAMRALLSGAGFEIQDFRARTVFCGFLWDRLIRGPAIQWNADLADKLPAWCASDWMFDCVKAAAPQVATPSWRRHWWGRLRRHLSERRWAGARMAHE